MIDQLRTEMRAAANAEKAVGMQAYMKSTMPYYGVNLPGVRVISKRVFAKELTCSEWQDTILDLWRNAQYREERYVALHLLREHRYRECITPQALPMLEELIVTGAWWGLVPPDSPDYP